MGSLRFWVLGLLALILVFGGHWLPGLVDHDPLLWSDWSSLYFAWLGSCWLTRLENTHVRVELFILLLQLLFDCLLIKPYFLFVWSLCCCCRSGSVFEIMDFSVSWVHVGELSRNWRLRSLGGRNTDGRHTLNDLLIFVGIDGNFRIINHLFLLRFDVLRWSRSIPSLSLPRSRGTPTLLRLTRSNQILVGSKLKALITSIGRCSHVAIFRIIHLGLIARLVNFNRFVWCPSLHNIFLVNFLVGAGSVVNHFRTIVHLLLPFYHVFPNDTMITYYFVWLLHLEDLRLCGVVGSISWNTWCSALIVLFRVWSIQSVSLCRRSRFVTYRQTDAWFWVLDCSHWLARLLHNWAVEMARGFVRWSFFLVNLNEWGTRVSLSLGGLNACVECWSDKNTVASIDGDIRLGPGNFLLFLFFLVCRKIWSIHNAIFKIHNSNK